MCHKQEKRAIKRRKRQLKRERKRVRREKLSSLRTRDPRKYWIQIQDLMGKPKGDAPVGVYYKGKELKREETLQAWAEMYLKQEPILVEEVEQVWVDNIGKRGWQQSDAYWDRTLDTDISAQEVWSAIKDAPNAKAVGIDEIPMELIKKGSDGIKEAVTMLFQRAFREEDVPDDWRSGVVVPIPKAGDTRQIENYRGITLLSTIGKTSVTILNRRLTG